MTGHPIAVALSNADLAALHTAMAEDVVFHSPILATLADEIRGRDLVFQILQTAFMGFGPPKNVEEFSHPDGRYMATFDGEIEGSELNIALLVQDDPEGRVMSIRVFMRPEPIVRLFRAHMQSHLCPTPIPAAIWALPATV